MLKFINSKRGRPRLVVSKKIHSNSLSSRDAPSFVIGSNTGSCSRSVKGRLPRLSAMTRTIQNRRRKQRVEPPLPSHRKDIVLLPEYTVTDSGENFLLFDSGPVEKRILVFGTSNNLELLSNSQIWFADGTFKHVPLLFYQLYTIHVFKGGKAIPVLYALLPDKKRKTYLEFLRAIVTLKPSLKSKIIITDFERAAIKVFATIFPGVEQHGCFFHFAQCIYRRIQGIGLPTRYANDADFALRLRQLAALAYVPLNCIEEATMLCCPVSYHPKVTIS